jgi:hypothetical protein
MTRLEELSRDPMAERLIGIGAVFWHVVRGKRPLGIRAVALGTVSTAGAQLAEPTVVPRHKTQKFQS